MVIGTTLLVMIILVAGIWVFVEVKRFRHKIFAVMLIVLIIFTYISFIATVKGKDINFKSIEGIKEGGQIYLSWLGSVFGNIKVMTSNAIHMDWGVNQTKTDLPE